MNDITMIPQQHFVKPSEKLTPEWAVKMANHYYYSGQMKSLLHGKNLVDIENFATGQQPMLGFEKMFQGNHKRQVAVKFVDHDGNVITDEQGKPEIIDVIEEDISGIDWQPLDLLSQPINSAVSLIHKQPIEVKATAMDPFAVQKKKNDRDFIRNKARNQAELKELALKMGVNDFPLGGPAGASDGVPMGLDLSNDEEQELYFDLFYKFRPESAYETLLTQLAQIQNVKAYEEREIRDHFWYGVSCHMTQLSQTTDLPYMEDYFHPATVYVPNSCIDKQFNDADVIYREIKYTVTQFYNAFGSEIGGEEELKKILTAYNTAHSSINAGPFLRSGEIDWGFTITCIFWAIKSIDIINFRQFVSKGKTKIRFDEENGNSPRFAQNTYTFFWIPGTSGIFRLERMKGFERKPGQEYKSPMPIRIYRSMPKSSVESCIGHVKMAQIAYIKLQHAIIKAKPTGAYYDLRFMRNAFETLAETNSAMDMKRLLSLLMVNNVYIGDTEGMGPEVYNAKPYMEMPGGLRDIEGYLQTFNVCVQNIGRITGINEQLTGQSPNPSGLVGLQKLLINSSVNSLHYVTEAITEQYRGLYRHFGWLCIEILKRGGAGAKAIKAMIGERKAEILETIDEIVAHQFGIDINIGQAEELRQSVNEKLNFMITNKMISPGDALLVERANLVNPKDAIAYLIVKEKQEIKRQAAEAEANRQAMIQAEQAKAQGNMELMNLEIQGQLAKIQAQAEADAKLAQLGHTLGLDTEYLRSMQKSNLQDKRGQDQLLKLLAGIERKADVKAREV